MTRAARRWFANNRAGRRKANSGFIQRAAAAAALPASSQLDRCALTAACELLEEESVRSLNKATDRRVRRTHEAA
jgi:hypothetical protein